jgi:hypothetical protein
MGELTQPLDGLPENANEALRRAVKNRSADSVSL